MLTFNDDKHEYRFSGTVVPSVTQVISPLYQGALQSIPQAILERKAAIGRAVHLACELHDLDQLDVSSLDPIVAGYFNGWLKFLAEHDCQWLGIEEYVYHKTYGYAGKLDRRGILNGKKCVIDIKTVAVVSKPTAVQLAGYEEAARADGDKERVARIAVQLKPDGTYSNYDFTRQEDRAKVKLNTPAISDFATFLSCLAVSKFYSQ